MQCREGRGRGGSMRSCSSSSPSSSPAQGCPLSSRLLGQGPDLWLHSELGDTRTPEPSDVVDQCRKSWPVGRSQNTRSASNRYPGCPSQSGSVGSVGEKSVRGRCLNSCPRPCQLLGRFLCLLYPLLSAHK